MWCTADLADLTILNHMSGTQVLQPQELNIPRRWGMCIESPSRQVYDVVSGKDVCLRYSWIFWGGRGGS
jgi:hypothetical protein